MPTIRLATGDDAGPIGRIYAPFCSEDSHVSFEVEPPDPGEIGRRIAKVLEGLAALSLQGFVTAHAGVALPNPASIGLHAAMGFEPVGTYRGVGFQGRSLAGCRLVP